MHMEILGNDVKEISVWLINYNIFSLSLPLSLSP